MRKLVVDDLESSPSVSVEAMGAVPNKFGFVPDLGGELAVAAVARAPR